MAASVEGSTHIKEALFEALSAVLSVDQYVRNTGEEQMKALEVTEEYGVFLAEFTVDSSYSMAVRQLASVMLKHYVEVHWSQHSDKYRAPETTEAAKAAIRQMLPVGLHEPVRKVRTSVAYAVSAIAHWDWPEAWPELFQLLMEALASGNPDVIHGAMRVLTEFCREVTDQSMPQVAVVILPEMYKIFTQPQIYSLRTRGRAVNIFDTCVGMLATINEVQKGLAKQILFPVLPQFMDVFVKALQAPDDGTTSDSGLKMEVLKALTTLLKSFSSHMSQWLPQVLGPVWLSLTQSAEIYMRTTVNALDDANDPTDSDGEVLGFENLVLGLFEFIHVLVETSRYRQMVKKSMEQLIYYIFYYMQITEDQARQWLTNPDQFVEDEDDETYSYNVRISAHELLLLLAAEFTKDAAPALCSTVTRHLQEAEQARLAGNVHWWKIHEATMLGVGSLSNMLMEHVIGNKLPLDINTFLQNVVLVDLNQNVSPFLLGRCLWMASRFATAMNAETLQRLEILKLNLRFLQATVTGIHSSQPACVRISAVRAVSEYCQHLQQNDTTHVLHPFIGDMVDGLLNISTLFSTDVISLCLETLCVVLEVDASFTAMIEPKVSPLVIALFLKYSGDPLIVSLAQDVISVIAKNEPCIGPLQQRLLPTLVSILQSPTDKIPFGLQSTSLDILTVLVRKSSLPLPDSLISQAFPATIHCTLQTDDNSTMQSGGECLRAFVAVALDQVIQWHDGQDCNGVYYIVKVVSKLLDSKTSEYTATHVGRLVSILIIKMGSGLGDYLDLMLRAVLSKMQQAETHTVIQSLVLVFAHLMHSQMMAVLDFLSSVPSPTGRPALEFVLGEWCAKQHLFVGEYERKVSCLALSKLIQYALESQDVRLQGINVQGDQVLNLQEGVKTRSKALQSPDRWTTIPLLVKVYKLLINELSNQVERSMSTRGTAGDDDEVDDDNDDNEWEDEENDDDEMHPGDSLPTLLSQMCDATDLADYEDSEGSEEDPDALVDPINQVDLQVYLTEFLRSLAALPCYATFSMHHTDPECQVLRTVGIGI